MKLIQPQLTTQDPTPRRQKNDAVRPVVAVESVERPKQSGSYSYHSHAKLPGRFAEQNQQAVSAYLQTAALDADGGELIGVDTYA